MWSYFFYSTLLGPKPLQRTKELPMARIPGAEIERLKEAVPVQRLV